MTCKDCIHEEICDMPIITDGRKNASNCKKFKYKSDFVEVVRCKDCKCCEHCYPAKAIGEEAIEGWYCKIRKKHMQPHDFCSYGERRTDNDL